MPVTSPTELEAIADASPPLMLSLFGTPRFTGAGADRASELLARPQALALLTFLALALPYGLRRRDELLAIFWPDSDATKGRNSLRQSLHLQRQLLPGESLVSRGNDEVGLDATVLRVDIRLFEAMLEEGREAEALQLYSGTPLLGFSLSGHSEFDAWLDGERERLRRRAVRAALVLAKVTELDGDSTRAADWARFALERAPYDEHLLRDVIELLVRLKDRAGAARLFSEATARIRSELGVAVSPETERLGLSLSRDQADAPDPVQRATSQSVRTTESVRLGTPMALGQPRAVSADARRLCLDGRQLAGQRSPMTIMKAIEKYEQAIRLSPDYAEAHSGLAVALCQAPVYVGYPGIDAWPRVRAHAARAIRLDPRLGEAHFALAHVTLCYDYDWTMAEGSYRRALDLDPIAVNSRASYALYFLTASGRFADALGVIDRARDDFPDVPWLSVYFGMVSVFGRQFEQGLREVDFVLASQPDSVQGHWVRGLALEGLGDLAGAIQTFERGVEITGRSSLLLAQLGRACVRIGDRDRGTQILAELDGRGESGGPAGYYSAEILAALGRSELALDRLYAAYRQRNPLIVFAGVRFGLDPLRGSRRFRDLLMRLGLHAYERSSRSASLHTR